MNGASLPSAPAAASRAIAQLRRGTRRSPYPRGHRHGVGGRCTTRCPELPLWCGGTARTVRSCRGGRPRGACCQHLRRVHLEASPLHLHSGRIGSHPRCRVTTAPATAESASVAALCYALRVDRRNRAARIRSAGAAIRRRAAGWHPPHPLHQVRQEPSRVHARDGRGGAQPLHRIAAWPGPARRPLVLGCHGRGARLQRGSIYVPVRRAGCKHRSRLVPAASHP